MSDIQERLADAIDDVYGVGHYWDLCEEAADEIERLRKRVEVLESTLRFMSGLLSTYGHWAGMHPQEVMGEVRPWLSASTDRLGQGW